MKSSTGSPSTRRTDPTDARPGDAGEPPDRASARAAWRRWLAPRPGLPPLLRPPPRPAAFVAAAVFLTALCAVLAGWGMRHRPDPAEFDLRDETSSSNVDVVNAGAEPDPIAAPRGIDLDALRGESLMTPLKTLGLPVALAAALAAAPTHADDEKTSDGKAKSAAVDAAGLEKLIREQAAAQMKELRELRKDVETSVGPNGDLRKEIEGLRRQAERLQGDAKVLEQAHAETRQQYKDARDEVERLRLRMGTLEEEMRKQLSKTDGLFGEMSKLNGQARKREQLSVLPDTRLGTGNLRVSNTYSQPVSVVVNGRSYRVRVGETLVLEPQPAGTFTYEVLGIQAKQTRPLDPGEDVTISVFTK